MSERRMSDVEMKDALAAAVPEFQEAAEATATAYAEALARALGAKGDVRTNVAEEEPSLLYGHTFYAQSGFEVGGESYSATIRVTAQDNLGPYVTVEGGFGHGDEEFLIEFRGEKADRWETHPLDQDGLGSWVEGRIAALARRAEDVVALAAPVMKALHPETEAEAAHVIILAIPVEGGPVKIRLNE